jgi:hypothetical protein
MDEVEQIVDFLKISIDRHVFTKNLKKIGFSYLKEDFVGEYYESDKGLIVFSVHESVHPSNIDELLYKQKGSNNSVPILSGAKFVNQHDPVTEDTSEKTVEEAVDNDDAEYVENLIKKNLITMDSTFRGNYNIAQLAVVEKSYEVMKVVTELMPDALELKDSYGRTSAHLIAFMADYFNDIDYKKLMKVLANKRPKTLITKDNSGRIPAHYAAEDGAINILKVIAEFAPESLSKSDNYGKSPATLASEGGQEYHDDCLEFLNEYKNHHKVESNNDTAIQSNDDAPKKWWQFWK